MKYFFVLGNNPTLSIAELSVVFVKEETKFNLSDSGNILIVESNKKIDPESLIKRLGGTIKIGEIIIEKEINNKEQALEEIKKLIKTGQGKYKFGISYYGQRNFNTKPLGMEIKKHLRKQDISARWVVSREQTLSSVVVHQNKLIEKGIEIVLIEQEKGFMIGRTLAVQPFKELSFRDYGRPARDDRSGMLPPKLAQIMINLSQAKQSDIILDPFCGSGTILTEAMIMGNKNLIGTDISEKAVKDTQKNTEWIRKKFQLSIVNFQLFNKSVTELSKTITRQSIDRIITEPYLGPQRGRINFIKVKKELEELYTEALKEFGEILKPNGRIVMIWPMFFATRNSELITPDLNGFRIVNPIPKEILDNKNFKLTNRKTIIYGREGQRIWREIVILER
jgi:tRNA G10  N-methylase Trm11